MIGHQQKEGSVRVEGGFGEEQGGSQAVISGSWSAHAGSLLFTPTGHKI